MKFIPYVAGLSEDIRRVCRRFGIRTVFKSGPTLQNHPTRVKDKLPLLLKSCMVYCIPCRCGRVYIGETVRRLEANMKEHEDACKKGMTEKSAIAEHVWNSNHPIAWNETAVVDQARGGKELLIKEALHICLIPEDQCFNRTRGLELPGCWVATLKARDVKPCPQTSGD